LGKVILMNTAIEETNIASDPAIAKATVVEFVKALAKRQATIDSGSRDETRTLH
jgi:hypothetical protein